MELASKIYIDGFGAIEIRELSLSRSISIQDLPSGYVEHSDESIPLMGVHFLSDPTQTVLIDDRMLVNIRKGIASAYNSLFDTRMLYVDIKCNNRKSIENARQGTRLEMLTHKDSCSSFPMFKVCLPNNVVGTIVPKQFSNHRCFVTSIHHKHFHLAINKQSGWVISIEHPEYPITKHMPEILMITSMQQVIDDHLKQFNQLFQMNIIQPLELYLE